MASTETLFYALPVELQRMIDHAFDVVVTPNTSTKERPPKRRKINPESIAGPGGGGGFLVDDPSETSGGGGFIADEGSNVSEGASEDGPNQIPFSLIPSALQRLDLPPDDDEILSVFKNAASGWNLSSARTSSDSYVSREDWRSVCAVLLEHNPVEEDARLQDDSKSIHMDGDDEDVGESDEYVEENSDSDGQEAQNESSDDDYMDGLAASSSRRRVRGAKSMLINHVSLEDLSAHPERLTSRQRQTCLDAIALFFPDVPPCDLEDQKIMIKDIQRVAKLLNEKLKAEEVCGRCHWGVFTCSTDLSSTKMLEMLELFSTSPDKSMGFNDFCRMMITAKLA